MQIFDNYISTVYHAQDLLLYLFIGNAKQSDTHILLERLFGWYQWTLNW